MALPHTYQSGFYHLCRGNTRGADSAKAAAVWAPEGVGAQDGIWLCVSPLTVSPCGCRGRRGGDWRRTLAPAGGGGDKSRLLNIAPIAPLQDDEEVSEFALDGLKQVMAIKSRVVLPYLVPKVSPNTWQPSGPEATATSLFPGPA